MPAFRHLVPGEKLQISASDYNALLDMAKRWYGQERSTDSEDRYQSTLDAGLIWIRNDTGEDMAWGDTARPTGLLLSSQDDLDAFKYRPLFSVEWVDADDPGPAPILCIAIEPIKEGQVGRAVIDGYAFTRIKIAGMLHRCAAYDPGTYEFCSAPFGYELIAAEPGEQGDTVWCCLRLGPQRTSGFWARITDVDRDTGRCSWTALDGQLDPDEVHGSGDKEDQAWFARDVMWSEWVPTGIDVYLTPVPLGTSSAPGNYLTFSVPPLVAKAEFDSSSETVSGGGYTEDITLSVYCDGQWIEQQGQRAYNTLPDTIRAEDGLHLQCTWSNGIWVITAQTCTPPEEEE